VVVKVTVLGARMIIGGGVTITGVGQVVVISRSWIVVVRDVVVVQVNRIEVIVVVVVVGFTMEEQASEMVSPAQVERAEGVFFSLTAAAELRLFIGRKVPLQYDLDSNRPG
jgi:hypothetical protein